MCQTKGGPPGPPFIPRSNRNKLLFSRGIIMNWDHLHYFSPSEFVEPDRMSEELLYRLDSAREIAGMPFHLTSTYRENDPRSHGEGLAADIACSTSRDRFTMIHALLTANFKRIGIYPNHIHVDVSKTRPLRVFWLGSYPEQTGRKGEAP